MMSTDRLLLLWALLLSMWHHWLASLPFHRLMWLIWLLKEMFWRMIYGMRKDASLLPTVTMWTDWRRNLANKSLVGSRRD